MRMWGLALVLAVLTVTTATASAGSGSTPFTLVFEGSRVAAQEIDMFAFGARDEGSFEAGPPLCDAGSAVDLEQRLADGWMTGLRRFDCEGGDGSVIARTWVLDGDPSWGYEGGAWQIIEGDGDFKRLRGKGTYARVLLDDGATSEVWRGVVDFDDVAPQVTVRKITLERPRRPGGAYVVRVSFRAHDDFGGPVSYLVTARSRFLLAAKYDTALPETSSVVLHVRPRTDDRMVRLEIEASDPLGNVRSIARTRALLSAS